jgi:hypothetical protein
VEDLGWIYRIVKNSFRILGKFPTSGRRTIRYPETLGNGMSYPRFFRIQKSDPTGSELAYCHGTRGHLETTVFKFIVYGHDDEFTISKIHESNVH